MKFKTALIGAIALIVLIISIIWMYDIPVSGGQLAFVLFLFIIFIAVVFLMDRSERNTDSKTLFAILACQKFWNTLIANASDIPSEEITFSSMITERRTYIREKRTKKYEMECQFMLFPKKGASNDKILFVYSFTDEDVTNITDNVKTIEEAMTIINAYYPFKDGGREYSGGGGNIHINAGGDSKGRWDSPEDSDGKGNGEANVQAGA